MDITELLNAVDNASSDWEFDDDEPDLSVEDGVASDEASADLAVEEEEEEVEAGEESQPAQGSVRRTGNEYIENLIRDSGLHIIREREWNSTVLEEAKERLKESERGTWELIAAVDVPTDWEKQQKAHQNKQK
ncbi:hypothetical protein AM587_10016408 [Phytophthora nicotianae]|uniref:Uncharacterized protein n=1 Tax=Phytophthora nicotianae TaxID=4792 RepID=A0A0W8CGN0_PHYNI|nr:hypothetical protein AM587_10016408 [Phytophthora nicotianae]